MNNSLKVTVTVAGALALAGAGIATGATSSPGAKKTAAKAQARVVAFDNGMGRGGPSDEIDAAAAYLGVTRAALSTDLQGGKTLAQVASGTSGKSTAGLVAVLVAAETAEIKAAVTAGRLTQAEADPQIAGLAARFTALVASTGPMHGRGGPGGFGGHGHGGPPDDLDAAASYLGVTSVALETDLQSGKTLAQVAGATSGKTTAGLVAALVTHETAELKAAVTAGTVTQVQADAMTASLSARFTDLVNGTRPADGPPSGPPGSWGGPGH